MNTQNTPEQRFQTHVDGLSAQIGGRISPSMLGLVRRAATLMMLCEQGEEELMRTGKIKDMKGYQNRARQYQSLCIALGVALNPRTATTGQRAAAVHDDHAAMMMDDD